MNIKYKRYMQEQNHRIKSYKILGYNKKEYSKFQLWICKKFKIIPAYESKIEVRFDLDSFERMLYGDIIKLNNGMTFTVIDKCVSPNWIIAESESVLGFKKSDFKPVYFIIKGTTLDY